MKNIMVDLDSYITTSRALADSEIRTLSSWVGAEGYKPDLWQWQFSTITSSGTYLLLENSQGIVAFNGLMPRKALLAGQEVDFIWSCDFIVCPSSRGRGLGRKMKKELLHKYSNSIIASLGISDSASNLLKIMGWESRPGLTEYRKIRRCNNIKDVGKRLVQAINYCYGLVKISPMDIDTNIDLLTQLPCTSDVNGLWSKVADTYSAAVVRDYNYLTWRYQSHPLASQCYRYLVLRDNKGNLEAVLVVRSQGKTLHIVDYLGPSEALSLKLLLLKSVGEYFQDSDTFSLCIVQEEWKKAALYQGFYKTNSSLNFSLRYPNQGTDDTNWFLMKGDSDGEFLEAAKYVAGEKSHD